MQHGYGVFGQHTAHNDGLPQRAVPRLAQRQQDSLEERGRLEQRLAQRHVQVKVEPLKFAYVVADPRQQDKIVEALRHFGIQIRGEYAGGLVDSRRRPIVRLGYIENLNIINPLHIN